MSASRSPWCSPRSVAVGEDALEHIAVTIDELPAVADWQTASANKSILFDKQGTNRSLTFESRKGDADAAFATAPYTRREQLRTGRHYGLTMEPRGVMATWDAAAPMLTVYGAAKVPFFNRRILSAQIGLPVEQIDMIENDVGGGYGARGEFYPEDFLIPFAARHVNRPVKWIEDRRENLMAMNHAREEECDLEVACARDGTILAIRGEVHTDMGAYMRTNGAVGARNVSQFMAGPYRVPHVKIDSHLWMTNKTPVGTYRGPGRFEACFFLERMIDMIAADLGIDRIEFRRRNLITAKEQPYPVATVQPTDAKDEYDSGEYSETLDRALKEIDWAKLAPLQGKLIDGKYHGLGVVCFIEGGAAGPKESARIEVNTDGTFSVYMGTSSVGQGVETVFAQIAADALEVPVENVRQVYHGSTAYVSDGYGAYHSRSTVMGGSAVLDATNNFMATLRQAAGKRMGCAESNVTLDVDKVSGGGRTMALKEFAGLTAEGAFLNKKHTYSYGCHVAHITVDARLGRIEIVDYVVVQDVGRAVNPLTLARSGARLSRPGSRRRCPRRLEIRRERPVPHRLARGLSSPRRHRLSQSALRRARRLSVADQPARRQGRRRGRHHRRRRLHGERRRQRAVFLRRPAAPASADADLHLGADPVRPAQGRGVGRVSRTRCSAKRCTADAGPRLASASKAPGSRIVAR